MAEKTLAMAANMGERGEICAFDIDKRRLSHLKANSERARVAALVTTTESLDELASESFDAILVDAPCSSVGALRRTSSLRHSYDDPRELAKVQAEIIDGVARLLKPGGRLVYATCSVLSSKIKTSPRRLRESTMILRLGPSRTRCSRRLQSNCDRTNVCFYHMCTGRMDSTSRVLFGEPLIKTSSIDSR